MNSSVPQIRPDINLIPIRHEGQRAAVVKDAIGLFEEPLLIKGQALQVFSLIDGKNSIQDIQLTLIRLLNGVFVSAESVEEVLKGFDKALLLDTEHYRREKQKLVEKYIRLPKRTAFLAGSAYPESAPSLRKYLDSFFSDRANLPKEAQKKIKALIVPHIDLDVARKVYAEAYASVAGLSPKRVLLLGTGHSLQDDLFSLTEKDFETPLGTVKTDRECVKHLRKEAPSVVAAHDLDHRKEHSLEFQLVFLQYLFGSDLILLPVLCGSFQGLLRRCSRPSDVPQVESFLKKVRAWTEKDKEKTLIVAGVDLSHIGPKFGHRETAESLLSAAREHDRNVLDSLCQGDVRALWREVQTSNNGFNVCGFSTLACLLELVPGLEGRVLSHTFWNEDSTQSAVSFAAAVLGEDLGG